MLNPLQPNVLPDFRLLASSVVRYEGMGGSVTGYHTRHERTRYVSGRNQIYGSYSPKLEQDQNYIPFVHFWERPLQILESSMNVPKKLSSRPLFSWDLPVHISTYTTEKIPTTMASTNNTLKSTFSKENKQEDLKIVTLAPKTSSKTRSERYNRTKDVSKEKHSNGYSLKIKKSNNRNKSVDETSHVIKLKEPTGQSSPKSDAESKRLTRKKKSKKPKVEKQKNKRKKDLVEKIKNQLNDSPRRSVVQTENSWATKTAKEKRKIEIGKLRMMEEPESPCELLEEKCEHKCHEDKGKATCVCFRGFTSVGNKCLDINECATNNGGCNGKCVNTIGSRRCICSPGFRLVDGVCADINECLLRNGHGPCHDRCTNTRGSYKCSCEGLPGTTLSSDNHTCEENNECNMSSSECSHSCIKVSGRSFCTCPDGMELGEDWKSCYDIDECSNPEDYKVDCPSECINTIGSYTCALRNTSKIIPNTKYND